MVILGRGGVMQDQAKNVNEAAAKEQQKKDEAAAQAEAGKSKKKKDKGPSKEEMLKIFQQFLEDTYWKQTVQEEKVVEEEEKNAADQLESEKKEQEETSSTEEAKPEESPVVTEGEVAAQEKEKDEAKDKQESKKTELVDREQTLEEIVTKYVDLKVPDKFVKDCLAALYTASIEREMKGAEDDNVPKALTEILLQEDAATSAVKSWWTLSPVERCVLFVEAIRQHQKLGNNVTESVKQAVTAIHADTPKQLQLLSKLLSVAILRRVYGLTDLAALTDNGKFHPLMLDTLQKLNGGDADSKKRLVELFSASKVDLLQVLPADQRTKEQLVSVLEERNIDFLCPLLKVQAQMWKQIKTDSNPKTFYTWIKENVDAALFTEEGFIQALMTVLLKHVTQVREENRWV